MEKGRRGKTAIQWRILMAIFPHFLRFENPTWTNYLSLIMVNRKEESSFTACSTHLFRKMKRLLTSAEHYEILAEFIEIKRGNLTIYQVASA